MTLARALSLLAAAVACAACEGGSTAAPDASPDGAPDAPADAGPCGADRFVTGELLDLDATTAQHLGVFNARFTVEGMPDRTAATAPNGRFELCAPRASSVTFDVDAPGSYLDGKAYIALDALGPRTASFRGFTPTRALGLYSYDPDRAHVLVYLAGDRHDVSLSGTHGTALAGNDDATAGTFAWAPGISGRYVLFPNVDAAQPTVTLTSPGATHTLPVAAGRLTLAAISFFFL